MNYIHSDFKTTYQYVYIIKELHLKTVTCSIPTYEKSNIFTTLFCYLALVTKHLCAALNSTTMQCLENWVESGDRKVFKLGS